MKSPTGIFALLLACLGIEVAPQQKGYPSPTSGCSKVGINAHIPDASDFSAMEVAGLRWARVDMTWDSIEPEPGNFNWGPTDTVAISAKAADVNLVGVLGYCPEWASSGPSKFYPPRSIPNWEGYVAATVGRYCDSIRFWILWNEPNCRTYFRGTADEYIDMILLPGAAAARGADPSCLIVGPDLAHLSSCRWDAWLELILKRAGSRFDIISHHCYQRRLEDVFKNLDGHKWPWEPPPVKQILQRCGQGGKPFWLTEIGWNSVKTGEEAQAKNLAGLLDGSRSRPWIGRVFIYELNDSPVEPGFGILRPDGSQKPAFQAIKAFLAKETR